MVDVHEDRVKAAAGAIFHFLKGAIADVEGAEATLNRERLLLYLEALKSRYFMQLVEDDPSLPMDIKIQISHASSGLNKSWPQVRQLVYDDSASRFAAVAFRLAQMQSVIVDAIGIQVTLNVEAQGTEIQEVSAEDALREIEAMVEPAALPEAVRPPELAPVDPCSRPLPGGSFCNRPYGHEGDHAP